MRTKLFTLVATAFVAAAALAAPTSSPGPAQLATIPSMGVALRNQGYSIIGANSHNSSGPGSGLTPNSLFAGAKSGGTAVVTDISPVAVPRVRLVFASYGGTAGSGGEAIVPTNEIMVRAAVWNRATSEVYAATFGGERFGVVGGRQIIVSDPIQVPISANTPFDVRVYASVTSPQLGIFAGSLPTGVFNGNGWSTVSTEGAEADDVCEGSAAGYFTSSGSTIYFYAALLGETGATPARSVALLGDSIMAGTGDAGQRANSGGWGQRVANNTLSSLVTHPSYSPVFGNVQLARGGETLAQFLSANGSKVRMRLAGLASTVISNYGTNDLGAGTSAATVKSYILQLAGMVVAQGQKFIQATILPRTTSTDGWRTVTNQSAVSWEANRQAVNTWLRDTSSSGFVQQAIAATGQPRQMFDFFDAAAAVEVNSSNVLTLNGGFWQAPTGAALYSGSVTSAGNQAQFTDTALTPATINHYRDYTVVWKTGPNAGTNQTISSQNVNGLVISPYTVASNIGTGNTYDIWDGITTVDGTHPTAFGHAAIAATFPTRLVATAMRARRVFAARTTPRRDRAPLRRRVPAVALRKGVA